MNVRCTVATSFPPSCSSLTQQIIQHVTTCFQIEKTTETRERAVIDEFSSEFTNGDFGFSVSGPALHELQQRVADVATYYFSWITLADQSTAICPLWTITTSRQRSTEVPNSGKYLPWDCHSFWTQSPLPSLGSSQQVMTESHSIYKTSRTTWKCMISLHNYAQKIVESL